MKKFLFGLFLFVLSGRVEAQQPDGFPHDKHAKLFPTCMSCHGGTTENGTMRSLPEAAQCATCHDGTRSRRVNWVPKATRPVGLLVFSHATHDIKAGAAGTCQSCHALAAGWMAVGRAAQATCGSCHAHTAASHYADESKCATCHRTLARATGLTDTQLRALPRTAAHDRADFIATHGARARNETASCATCHAQQSCARCHADAATNKTILGLAPDARVARLVAKLPPGRALPADHGAKNFGIAHGPMANASTARCAVCHTQASCTTCHTGTAGRTAIATLSLGAPATTRAGAAQAADWNPAPHSNDPTRRTVRVHATGFAKSHGPAASSENLTCMGCHAQRFCKDCHAAERVGTRRYHPANFVSRHAPETYGRESDCAACHSVQAFCRDCHKQVGLATTNSRRGSGFHNGQPTWLLQHGQAARQELTTCATCHQQNYCMQCHSSVGWRVSPHGPDFNAARMAARNPILCLRCHLKNPLTGK